MKFPTLAQLFAAAAIAYCTAPTQAQYQIQLRGEAGSSHSRLDDRVRFYFDPGVRAETSAFITLSSPNGFVHSYVNHPDRTLAQYTPRVSTSDIVEEANGTWTLTIDEGDATHQYAVEMTLSFPFDQLPYFASSTLVNGHPVGPFDWSFVGQEAAYPGGSGVLTASLWTTGFGDRLDQTDLPITATTWTPSADFTLESGYIGAISARGDFAETNLLNVHSVTPLTPNAPDVVFTSFSLRYLASLSASLEPAVVPEPSSMVLTFAAISGLALLWRRGVASPTHF